MYKLGIIINYGLVRVWIRCICQAVVQEVGSHVFIIEIIIYQCFCLIFIRFHISI